MYYMIYAYTFKLNYTQEIKLSLNPHLLKYIDIDIDLAANNPKFFKCNEDSLRKQI